VGRDVRINHPREAVREGQMIERGIDYMDMETKEIFLITVVEDQEYDDFQQFMDKKVDSYKHLNKLGDLINSKG
jgi:transcriptional accessory protein Tex/SPT6